jgi:D-3-phosphoglycerate dehydrogenase
MSKHTLALGTPIVEPYLSQIKKSFRITPVSQLITPGIWPPEEAVRTACTGHEVIVIEADQLGESTLRLWQADGLKLLGCARGNPVNVDAYACNALGIPLFYTPGRNAQSVAEYTLTLMLALQKRIHTALFGMHDKMYLDKPVKDVYNVTNDTDVLWMNERLNVYTMQPLGEELYGRTLAIIGFGAIGRRVAAMAAAFGMRIVVYDPYCDARVVETAGAEYASLDQALSQADIVSVHLPVTPATKGIIDASWFSRMKPGAKLINTARAAVVDQRAMVDALESGRLSGAAVDVMWIEPCPSNHPFLSMPNVIVLPHQAGATVDIDRWQSRMIAEELERYLRGETPLHPYPGK